MFLAYFHMQHTSDIFSFSFLNIVDFVILDAKGTHDNFFQFRRFHAHPFQVGCDLKGETISMTLFNFIHYAESNNDRNPLIVFDSMIIEQLALVATNQDHDDPQFSNSGLSPSSPSSSSQPSSLRSIQNLSLDFSVPEIFADDDLLQHLSFEDRPPYQWLLLAPARSGSPVKNIYFLNSPFFEK